MDSYEQAWRANRSSAAELVKWWHDMQPEFEWWKRNAARMEEQARQEKIQAELQRVVNKLEPVPNWFGPCIVDPKGGIYPVLGSHEGTASQVLPKVYPEEYRQMRGTYGFVDSLNWLCDEKGWVRVSWYGEITKAYWSDTPKLSQAQQDALMDMATEGPANRLKMGGRWEGFCEHLLRALDKCAGREMVGAW